MVKVLVAQVGAVAQHYLMNKQRSTAHCMLCAVLKTATAAANRWGGEWGGNGGGMGGHGGGMGGDWGGNGGTWGREWGGNGGGMGGHGSFEPHSPILRLRGREAGVVSTLVQQRFEKRLGELTVTLRGADFKRRPAPRAWAYLQTR